MGWFFLSPDWSFSWFGQHAFKIMGGSSLTLIEGLFKEVVMWPRFSAHRGSMILSKFGPMACHSRASSCNLCTFTPEEFRILVAHANKQNWLSRVQTRSASGQDFVASKWWWMCFLEPNSGGHNTCVSSAR